MKLINKLSLIFVFLFISSCHLVGKYSEQGKRIGMKINNELISLGFCSSPAECVSNLDLYGSDDTEICFEIYNSSKLDVVSAFISSAIKNGLEPSNDVPISIRVYSKSRSTYGNSLFRGDPIISVKISK